MTCTKIIKLPTVWKKNSIKAFQEVKVIHDNRAMNDKYVREIDTLKSVKEKPLLSVRDT